MLNEQAIIWLMVIILGAVFIMVGVMMAIDVWKCLVRVFNKIKERLVKLFKKVKEDK